MRLALLAPACSLLAGCFLPVSTAAPQSAATVGQGNLGVTIYTEIPTLDLAAKANAEPDTEDYAYAPFPTLNLQGAYGLTRHLDAEVGVEGVLWWFIFPLPTGFSIGGRYQFLETGAWDAAAGARVGYVGVSASSGDDRYDASAAYGNAFAAIQLRAFEYVRPGLALSVVPAAVFLEREGGRERYNSLASSATLSVTIVGGVVQFAPFATIVYFNSPNLQGETWLATGGLSFALRPRKRPPTAAAPPPP